VRAWTATDIKSRYPALADELQSGDVTLFVGAGLSRNAGIPLWDELMLPLANELALNHNSVDPITVAQYYSDAHAQGRYLLNSHIVRQLRHVPQRFSFPHALIKELPLRAIVTTNFDDLIERALAREPERRHHVIITDEDLSYHSNQDLPVVKANGCVSRPDSLILTRKDFESYADMRPALTNFIKSLMTTSTFLFLGTSMRDPAFVAFNAEVLRDLTDHRRPFYWLVPSTNAFQLRDYHGRGIELVDLEAQSDDIGDSVTSFLEALVRLNRMGPSGAARPSYDRSRERTLLGSRLGPGLSLEVNPEHVDDIHRYSLVERTDLLDYESGDFVSLRRLSGVNVSQLLSTHLVYLESSERKLSFSDTNLKAFDAITKDPLEVEPLVDHDALRFTIGYKIFFRRPLSPGEMFDIVYRISLPGELRELSDTDEVMSISLARIGQGTMRLRFNVCLNFRPSSVRIECLDSQGSRIAVIGDPARIEPYQPREWYERQLDIDWSASPTIVRWESYEPDSTLYILNYRT
jgi:NAD-dependent SIR2 family protein deacetylase